MRADATFALGALGDAAVLPTLVTLARSGDVDVATNAVGAIARLARKSAPQVDLRPSPTNAGTTPNPIAAAVCPMLGDGRPSVRANALITMAALKQRCADGRAERKLLADDASDLVRAGAARLLIAAPLPEDQSVVDRCSAADRSAEVARLCRPAPSPLPARGPSNGAAQTHPVTVFVVGETGGGPAKPRAPYLLEYADGVLRSGVADRRGAIFDPVAPDGEIALRRVPTP